MGKFESPGCSHCLEHHCADVAACFQTLLSDPVVRARFEHAAEQTIGHVSETRLAVLAFLHDFGKLNAGFQFKVYDRSELPPGAPPHAGHIEQALLCFEQEQMCEAIGLYAMDDTWGEGFLPLLYASLAHHGRPAKKSRRSGTGPPAYWKPYAGYDPLSAAKLLGERIRLWFSDAFDNGPALPDSPALAHLFAGTVALADQIGSDEKLFSFVAEPDPNYFARARRRANHAVKSHLLSRQDWATRSPAVSFVDCSIIRNRVRCRLPWPTPRLAVIAGVGKRDRIGEDRSCRVAIQCPLACRTCRRTLLRGSDPRGGKAVAASSGHGAAPIVPTGHTG